LEVAIRLDVNALSRFVIARFDTLAIARIPRSYRSHAFPSQAYIYMNSCITSRITMSGITHFMNLAWVSGDILILDFSSIGTITMRAINKTAKMPKIAINASLLYA
jgi:hypothetical protein